MTDVTPRPYQVSNSEIQVFKDCRRKWWLNYYRRLKPRESTKTGALALGSRIHEALDMYYSTETPLLEAHAQLVEKDRDLLIADFQDTSELDSEAELGRIMLEGYLDWVEENGIDAELDMISTEELIRMPLMDGKVELDVVLRDGAGEVVKHGTGNGPISAFIDVLGQLGVNVRLLDYVEHTLSAGGDAQAASYIELEVDDQNLWGVGIDGDIATASLKALISAVNRSLR